MRFWNKILGKKKDNRTKKQSDFNSDVKKSIDIIGSTKSLENDELLTLLTQNGIEENNGIEIITFLPIAFVRKWLTDVDWPKTYLEHYSDSKRISKRFSDNHKYLTIEKIVDNYWNDRPNNDIIVNIAGRSAEFNAINKLLNDGGKMVDIKMTETVIIIE
ncbi:hypothetical protein [Spongiimicrobium salis]|uniref:hypothetical protein n=1 Tax=Spongiimicrobium salis TaxID=1667022 RepID=UPI00374D6361